MYVIDSMKFLDGATSPQESEVLINTRGSQLILDVSGTATTFALKVLGTASLEPSDSWTTLAAISLSDYTTANTIASKGIYAVPIDGVGNVKISLTETNGAISVTGKAGE